MRSYHSQRSRATLCGLVVLLAGCSARESGQRAAPEPIFDEIVSAVRDGASDTLRADRIVVSDDDLAALDEIGDRVRRINLSRTEITDKGMAHIGKCSRLVQLRLASPSVTDAGLDHVATLGDLRFLHLLDMPITDAGLDKLHGLKQLESLYLDRTRTTDEGLARLLKALPSVHLHIDDHHHPLDKRGSEHSH